MKAVLHIGQQKTGSTALQEYLSNSREHLLKNGILYPSSLGNKKQNFIFRDIDLINKLFSKHKRNFKKELTEHQPNRVIISEENLFSIPQEGINNIYKFLKNFFSSIQIVVYLRRQDDHFLSIYNQNVRGSKSYKLREIIDESIYTKKHSYLEIMKRWRLGFPESDIFIRPYGKLINNDIIDDFSDLIGIETTVHRQSPANFIKNPSLDAVSIELMRIFNKLEESNDLQIIPEIKTKFRTFLYNTPVTKKFKLSSTDKNTIRSLHYEDNEKLCTLFGNKKLRKYLLRKPLRVNKLGFYNDDIEKDNLYNLYFRVYQSMNQ